MSELPYSIKNESNPWLADFRDRNILTDIIFRVNGTHEFAAHKLIMATASEYFEKLFLGSFKKPKDIVPINGITPETFKYYLAYVYAKEIKFLNWRSAFELFKFIN